MKIAFTVYNLAFVSNWIERLMPYWENCEIVIFHIANLQGQKEPAIEGVKSYDVSSRSYSEIIDIIEHERIDLWINFNFRSLFELFFQRICALQNIKSVYLEHGFFSQNTLHFKTQKAQKNIWETVNRQLNFWKKYIGVLYHAKKRLQEWRILQQVYFKNNFKYSPFDYYFIFSQREYSLLSNVFPLDESNTSLIGYPIFSSEKDKKEATSAGLKMNGEVLYVHQPFILDGYATISYEEEKKYFLDLEKQLLKKYKRLIVLLHPRENLSTYIKRFADTQIDIIQSPNNYSCFTDKSLIIGHYSTALLYALYFEKPTIILNYPSVKNDPIFQECFPTVEDMENICTIDFQIDINKKIPFAGKENTYEHIAHEILLKCGNNTMTRKMNNNKKTKVCLISSCGGHFMELMQLLPLVKDKLYYIVTEKNVASTGAVEKHPHHYLVQQEREGISFIFKFGWNILLSFIYFIIERPTTIITTGAGASYPTCLFARIFKRRIIYVESFAKLDSESVTGKMVYPFADYFFVQWPEMKKVYPKGIYSGTVY